MELGGHVLLGAAHAQRAGGILGANAHTVEEETSHQMDPDHIGGAGHAHRHTGSDYHQIALLDQPLLFCGLHGKLHQLIGVVGVGHHQRHHAEVQ